MFDKAREHQGSKRATFSWPGPAQNGPSIREARQAREIFSFTRFFPSRIWRSLRYNYQCSWEQIISAITNMVRLYCRS